ncbi:response regulator [Shewanella gaetbuli]
MTNSIKRSPKFSFANHWVIFAIGLLLTSAIAVTAQYYNQYQLTTYTANLANQTENLIKKRFQFYEYGLIGTRAAISTVGVNNITRTQFEKYSRSLNLKSDYPGALGFGLIRRVKVSDEGNFIKSARLDGAPQFSIRTLTPHNKDRFVIQYIYPVGKNSQAVGLDIGSENNRRTAALLAAQHDRSYLTAPITLVQENKKPRKGALILLPIYAEGFDLSTEESRQQAVTAWAYTPLVIDDVLANLENEALVTLTNMTENAPFYRSNNTFIKYTSENTFTRNIFVLGQQWKMELIPTNKAINELEFWDVTQIMILGVLLTLVSTMLIILLRRTFISDETYNEIKTYQLSVLSVKTFIESRHFKRGIPLVLICFFSMFSLSTWYVVTQQLSNMSTQLTNNKLSAISTLDHEVERYKRDVRFLAKTPAIVALKQLAINSDSSEQDLLLKQQWNDRLVDIFKAYMLSNTDVYQVRFIEANNDWQERVKIQRVDDDLISIDSSRLQSKQNEDYIEKTLQVGDNEVYISDMNLNREFGKIEQPSRPVWRFSTPIYHHNGVPYGIIIINTNANNILHSLVRDLATETNLYVTNKQGYFLLHPNESREFTFQYGDVYRWEDEFTPSTLIEAQPNYQLAGLQKDKSYVFASVDLFGLDDNAQRFLKIYSTKTLFSWLSKVLLSILGILIVLSFVFFICISIQYWFWLREKIRQRQALSLQKKEQQRNKEMIRFKGLLESAPDAIFVVDETGIIQIANAQAEKMFQYQRFELEGKAINKLVPIQLRAEHSLKIQQYVAHPKKMVMAKNRQVFALRADGHKLPVEVSLSSIKLDDSLLVTASLRDITKRLDEEAKLNQALQDAESATKAKSAFLANTSHEIRTPLNAVIGLSYLLAEEQLTYSQQQLVSKIQTSGKSLLGIVNDVLDLAKIEADEMALEEQSFELREFFEEVCSVFSIQAEAKGLTFKLELDAQLPIWVIADMTRLRQIVVNLLSNALKFTTEGGITISVNTVAEQPSAPAQKPIRITIKDTGIGISPQSQKRLFKPFNQADSSTARRFGGTGLGLSIVHQLVKLMGGKINVESEFNRGCKFWVDLILKEQSIEDIAELDNLNQTIFILIAEDNPTDAEHLKQLTRSLGWRSEVVKNGAELVNTYLSRAEKHLRAPDALLVDWKMPVMDGLEAIKTLQEQQNNDVLSTVLMMSAHDKESFIQSDPEQLVKHFLVKPANASLLFNAVNDVVTQTTGNANRVHQSTSAEAVGAMWLPHIKILIVDDRPINLTVIGNILQRNGAEIHKAESGEAALDLLADKQNDFDAVLMDIQMPGIDGLETTQRIRNNLGLQSLPIIALTAGALVEERNRAIEAGMDEFLTKPVNPSKAIKVLRAAVEKYRKKEITIVTHVAPLKQSTAWPVVDGLNHPKAKEILLNDASLFLITLNNLFDEHSNLISIPEVDDKSYESIALRQEVKSQVHKLRSISGMVGADDLQHLAQEAEHILQMTQPAKEVLIEISLALQVLKHNSQNVLAKWKKDHFSTIISDETVHALNSRTLNELITLLKANDLKALEEFEKLDALFKNALSEHTYIELKNCLAKLNYSQAIDIIEFLNKNWNSNYQDENEH